MVAGRHLDGVQEARQLRKWHDFEEQRVAREGVWAACKCRQGLSVDYAVVRLRHIERLVRPRPRVRGGTDGTTSSM